jgi:hypothetical protein
MRGLTAHKRRVSVTFSLPSFYYHGRNPHRVVVSLLVQSPRALTSELVYKDYVLGSSLRETLVYGDDYSVAYPSTLAVRENNELALNISKMNAKHLLELLGLDTENLVGEEAADAFVGRVLMTIAMAPADDGVSAFDDGNAIECGRAEGYLEARLDELTCAYQH